MTLTAYSPPSAPPALPVPPEPAKPVKPPDGQYDLKLIAIVIVADVVIIGSSFAFAYLAAGSHVLRALLGATLLSILESMRIPVALKLGGGKIASKAKVGLAVLVLAGGMLATTINAVPIINGLWSSRLETVRQDEAKLAKAQSAKNSADAKKVAAGDAADRAAQALKIVKGHTKAIRGSFIAANNASYANTQQNDRTVADDEAALSADRQNSNLHLLYAAITGEEVSSITDQQLAPLLRVAVFVPALLLGILTTAVALLAVSPVAAKASPRSALVEAPAAARNQSDAPAPSGQETVPVRAAVEIPDEAVLHFLAPSPDSLARRAKRPALKVVRPRGRPRKTASRKGGNDVG